ncbi:TadA family conjugal transfer-associated ATPase [Tessaracoccus terricola]
MIDEQLEALQTHLGALGREHTPADVAAAMRRIGMVVTDRTMLQTMEAVRRNSTGAGPLEDLVRAPGVSDVVVNGAGAVFVDRGQGLEPAAVRFLDDAQVRRLAVRLAAAAGRRLDDAQPFVDGRLADGTRLHAVLAPVASPGTCISLRVPASSRMGLAELAASGSVAPEARDLLQGIIAAKVPFLISGGTGTGKTTLLAALLALVPAEERIVVVEDARELDPAHPHCVRLEARPANTEGLGAITLTQLVRQALRMRPDRVVLGEVRGAELSDLLTALNTGHEGGCGTIHANSIADVPARLEALAALGGLGRDACHAQVAAALRVAVHVRRLRDGRRQVAEIGLFRRGDDALVRVQPAVSFEPGGGSTWHEGAAELRRLVALT